MPTKSHRRIPELRLHKPSGQGRVILDGRHIYCGKWGTPEAEAKYHRVVSEWLACGSPSTDSTTDESTQSPTTVNDLILAYFTHAQGYYRKADGEPTNEINNIRQALRPLRRLYGKTVANEFGPLKLSALREDMIGLGWSRGWINDCVDRIKRMFKWSVAREMVPPSVFHGLQALDGLRAGRSAAKETKPVTPVPQADIKAVLPFLTKPVAAMVQLQQVTGMRPGETINMRACDIKMRGNVWKYEPESHKTKHHGHRRIVFLGPKAQQIIQPFLRRDLSAYLFSPKDGMADRFSKSERRTGGKKRSRKRNPKRTAGEKYTVHSYRRSIYRACIKAKVHHWHPHQLRHNRGTEIDHRYGREGARVSLGHAVGSNITSDYVEPNLDLAKRIALESG